MGALTTECGSDHEVADALLVFREGAHRFPGHYFETTAALLLSELGRGDEAALELERVTPHLLADPVGPRWLGAATHAAYAATAVGATATCQALYAALRPYSGRFALFGGANFCTGPVDRYLGLLAARLGRTGDAIGHLETAVTAERRYGLLPGLARSLANPGTDIPAITLTGGQPAPAARAQPVLDDAAIAAYRARLAVLEAEEDGADAAGDAVASAALADERQHLIDQLQAGLGLAGRRREFSDEAERARVAVTKALRGALTRIEQAAPLAGAHLRASLRTGRTCRYDAAPGGPARWLTR